MTEATKEPFLEFHIIFNEAAELGKIDTHHAIYTSMLATICTYAVAKRNWTHVDAMMFGTRVGQYNPVHEAHPRMDFARALYDLAIGIDDMVQARLTLFGF